MSSYFSTAVAAQQLEDAKKEEERENESEAGEERKEEEQKEERREEEGKQENQEGLAQQSASHDDAKSRDERGMEVEQQAEEEERKEEEEEQKEEGGGKVQEGDEQRYYFCDNTRHVEYLAEMVRALQRLGWRRFDVQFGSKVAPHVHDMWLKKKGKIVLPQWIIAYDPSQSDIFVDVLVRILAADHDISLACPAPSSSL